MDGILYAFNLTGMALQQANAEIERLRAENETLHAKLAERTGE